MKRGYSDETGKTSENSKPSSSFLWMAGTGGFFGALIYYLGKPENGQEDDKVKKCGIETCDLIV